MIEIIFYLCSIIFGLCSAVLMGLGELLNLSYREISVYFNLYFQYIIIIMSCLSVLFAAIKMVRRKFTLERLIILICAILYNAIIINIGKLLYNRYGKISVDDAFFLCKEDLMSLSKYIDININSQFYREGWTEYFIVNIIIFIILFLFILIFNYFMKKLLKCRQ